MNHSPASPHFDFSSIFVTNNGSVCPFALKLDLPNSKLDGSPAFSVELHSTLALEGCPGLGSGSASPPNSKHAQEARRKLGATRGGGERGMNKSGHTVYKGVRKRKGDRWVSEIREPGKKSRIWLGTFSTPEMAATAYDVAAFNLKTPYAYLNFPEYVSSLPIPPSRSPKHIQEAAAAAAVAALPGVARSSHIGRTGGLVATPTYVDEISTSLSGKQQKKSISMEMEASSLTDEDMLFDMPNLLADMAEGLMITPPLHYLAKALNAYTACDYADSSLWSL